MRPLFFTASFLPVVALLAWTSAQALDEGTRVTLFGNPLSVGGDYEAVLRQRTDFDLADSAQDDLTRLDQELSVELYYPISDSAALFVEASAIAEIDLHAEDGEETSETKLELGQAWLLLEQFVLPAAALQIGRQNVVDVREWWWDADLDALRLLYRRPSWDAELGVAEQLARVDTQEQFIDPEQDRLMRAFARAGWDWAEGQRLAAYWLYQKDRSAKPAPGERVDPEREDESDADLWWLGAQALGRRPLGRYGEINYWLDAALLRGDETLYETVDDDGIRVVESRRRSEVSGWGVDLGVSWTAPGQGEAAWPPTLTLGYAVGSGDSDPDDRTERAFRQTGLHDNNGRFQGVNRFDYYGELLQPELSNLRIITAAIGLPLLDDSSVELVYHRYRQVAASDQLRDGQIDAELGGASKDVGQALDLIVGIEEWDNLELELVGSVFEAGDAYGELAGERAYNVFFKVTYDF